MAIENGQGKQTTPIHIEIGRSVGNVIGTMRAVTELSIHQAAKLGNQIQRTLYENGLTLLSTSTKGKLWMTRADHLRVHSSPPIDARYGDDVCHGDTLSNEELAETYKSEIIGIKNMLKMEKESRERMFSGFLDGFESNIEYYRKRGLQTEDAEKLLELVKIRND